MNEVQFMKSKISIHDAKRLFMPRRGNSHSAKPNVSRTEVQSAFTAGASPFPIPLSKRILAHLPPRPIPIQERF